MQPNWNGAIAFANGKIAVSTFPAIYAGHSGEGSYERRNLEDAFHVTDTVNDGVFARENAATDDGRVRHLQCISAAVCALAQ